MRPAESSRTAKLAAIARGQHRLLHRRPWIFDDPFALPVVGPGWQELYAAISALFREPEREQVIGFVGCARPRYAEDRLARRDVRSVDELTPYTAERIMTAAVRG